MKLSHLSAPVLHYVLQYLFVCNFPCNIFLRKMLHGKFERDLLYLTKIISKKYNKRKRTTIYHLITLATQTMY